MRTRPATAVGGLVLAVVLSNVRGACGFGDGEATTTTLHRDRDSRGMAPLKKDARDGGAVAGRTRKDIERQTGKPVISPGNFKQLAGRGTKKLKAEED